MSALRLGYIRNPIADWFWFISLPVLAVAFAMLSEVWLGFVALASINLWITVPHHFATWCRTFGLREDWDRFRSRVILGPLVIVAAILAGFTWAPLTVFLVTMLWDHQHSVMQQHGLARIYDFKAKTGTVETGRLDLWLNIVLFVNHLITVPLWTEIWVQQLYTWNVAIDASAVKTIHLASYSVTAIFLLYYLARVAREVAMGGRINPMKYLFLLSSYGLWYYAGWHTNSLLVFGIAHRIMHGVQYLVIVFWFLQRKRETTGATPWMLPKLNPFGFIFAAAIYAVLFQLLLLKPMSEFTFGLSFINELPLPLSPSESSVPNNSTYELYAATVINSTALVHYYFDSFIWKIRDEKTQQGL